MDAINQILNLSRSADDIITDLKVKSVELPECDVHRASLRRRLRPAGDRADPRPVRRQRADGRRRREPRKPVFVEDAEKFLRQQTDQPIKWALPGPMTMIDTLYDRHYKSREKLAWQFATILNQEAKELEAAGVDIIQFDEPAFNVFFDDVQDWGVAMLERAAEGLRAETVVHICYGYGIRRTRTGRRLSARNGGSTRSSSRCCGSPASTSSRWRATTRTFRWT